MPEHFRPFPFLCQRVVCLTLFLLIGMVGCNVKRGAFQGSFLGSGFYRPHASSVLSVLWRRHIDPNYNNKVLVWKMSPEERSTPVIDEDTNLVCVGSERQYLTCFHSKTGKIKWFKKLQGRIAASPIIHDDTLYIGTTSGLMYAFDRNNGTMAWKKPYQADGEILSKATIATFPKGKPLLVFTLSNNKVLALEAKTGKWKWLYRKDPPDQLSIRGQAPPLFHEGVIYTGFSDGSIAAINAQLGTKIWEKSLRENDRFPDVDTELVIEEELIYATSYSGSLHALKWKTGKKVWKQKLTAATKPLVSDGNLFISTSDGRIYKFDAETGRKLWKKPKKFRKAGAFMDLIADDYYVYASTSQYGIYVLGRDQGKLKQILRFGKQGFATPVLQGSHLFALSYAGFVYSLTTKKSPNAIR